MSGEGYNGLAQKYLEDGKKLLNEKDYPQASEKFWGAASVTAKAAGEKLGLAHDGHRRLFQVISEVAKRTQDNELIILFASAGELHRNFYENWLTPEQVQILTQQVEQLIEKLSAFCNGQK